MAEYVEPFTLYPRKMKDGRRVWYYRARDAQGQRLGGVSTGKLSKAEAYSHCNALFKAGQLIPAPKEPAPPKPATEVRRSRRPPTLAEFAAEWSWWEWTDEGPACTYCKSELRRSEKEKPAVQRGHADRSYRVLHRDFLPIWGAYRMDQVTPEMCEELMADWADEDISHKTINNKISVVRVMFSEAARVKKIPESPWDYVKGYKVSEYKRGKLSIDEYRALMDPAYITDPNRWTETIYYDINLLASVTGLRLGECLALHKEDIHRDAPLLPGGETTYHITVAFSWNMDYGEGPQKTKRGTDELPVPRYVGKRLWALALATQAGGYLFSLDADDPAAKLTIARNLYKALASIGISNDERAEKENRPPAKGSRQERKISFHSWRVFANTYFRSRGVADEKVRELTRHESPEMTEHYTSWSLEDFREIAAEQEALMDDLASPVDAGKVRLRPLPLGEAPVAR